MADPPAPKRIKLSDDSSSAGPGGMDEDLLEKYFDELDQVQESIENTIDAEAARILEIQHEFTQRRKPLFEARSRIIKQVPGFWLKALMGHELLQVLFTNSEDRKLLGKHLVDLRVEEIDKTNGFRIIFEFSANRYLEKNILWKEFRYNEDGTEVVTSSGVQWKPGQDVTKRDGRAESFFTWFNAEEQDFEIGLLIKEKIFQNPMAFYSLAENPSIYDIDGDGYGGSRRGFNSLRGIGGASSSSSESSSGSSSSESGSGSSDSEDDGSSSDSSDSDDVVSKIPPRSMMGQSLRMASVAHPAPESSFEDDLPSRPKRSREDMEKTQPNSVAQSPRSPSVLSMHLSSASGRRDSSFRMDISSSGSASTTGASPTANGYASPQAPNPAATPMIPS
eukprot:TRINITY_DN119_c0_g1_i1.p1 TRINITY_DN119_c0_g1~~TRINITY_DN119_c0_g1_i1.p1  ORF type:complete len:392 (-),score=72.88 TRINITY_DN119_c0_g1_i1:215-1390(-)